MRRLLPALLLLVPLACGGGGGGESVQAVVAGAPAQTVEAGSARTSMVTEVVVGGEEVELAFDGLIDFETGATVLTGDFGDMLGDLGVDGGFVARMVDGVVYMQSELFAQGLPGVDQDTWLRIDPAALAEQQGLGLQQLGRLGQNDPTQGLAVLRGAEDVREIGEEEVDGVATTHYRTTIDLRKAAEDAGAITDQEAFDTFLETLDDEELRMDAWIDDEDRVRRIVLPMAVEGSEVTLTIEYSDFGVEVDVAEPPAADVVDFQEVLDAAGMGGA